ncbi:hypothetical protein [Cyclobacterium amurskyense]|jgi:hypothetical protein|uniref:Uncharacterized protein n=1 Tax=Cyclobacterium amurskyense TaxID=320787 RepID=A0A0H4PDJ5_9BACT|nr:hypothetical protein [Cyclobacterium amurskyense]AKP52501.1 hypothetical protein CA2015_3101 [Cyclobacterium amurskyense]|tara:strand:+ start:17977 stop:18375 length:399 start_codon:yes stop_codon:yes gene_type:complete
MKKVILVLTACILTVLSFAKERTDKTFLIIFDKDELAYHQANPSIMELNFSSTFHTKLYSGNSETALLVTVPFADWTVCEMGKAIVKVSVSKELALEEVAFRIIDLDVSRKNFKSLLSDSSGQNNQGKNSTN